MVGSSHVIDSTVVPSWTEVVGEEDSHDGNLVVDWTFVQDGVLDERRKVDHKKKMIYYDLSKDC